MVVAEVPLWVVHSSAAPESTSATTTTTEDATTAALPSSGDARASSALQLLLQGAARSSSSSATNSTPTIQASAIYSIDVHPTSSKFATGGGDGTVRIWNTQALFAQKSTSQYKSSKEYESSSSEEEGSSSEQQQQQQNQQQQPSSPMPRASTTGESPSAATDNAVHDLSNVVRRKKDGGTPKKSSPRKSTSMATVSSPSKQQQQQQQYGQDCRLLCTLSAHTGSSVMAVRFSTSGQYLASAGDDAVVCIYAQQASSTSSTHNKSNKNNLVDGTSVEQWMRIKLCRGHGLDVVGIAWAPDDSHLVSCSLDSNTPIIVWKLTDLAQSQQSQQSHQQVDYSNILCNPYKVLGKGLHKSTVKGVTFDPAGTYIASSGDDPSVCIWRAHDDWGLEKRIDASSGIFRQWSSSKTESLSSQSLFRRLSWSTDGSYICSTNAVVKNKHVASTISRDGWAVSTAKSTASGAANLVGHKQPVVACRHCSYLLDTTPTSGENGTTNNGGEPEYATLLALGDKRGFVTVWSTKKSRPVFKIQCSETRSTVTDLAWGRIGPHLLLLVTLLDGQVVALKFGVPDEVGRLLDPKDQARLFQLRYGIDLNDVSDLGRRRLFVGENSGPKLIENALQYTLEEEEDNNNYGGDMEEESSEEEGANTESLSTKEVKALQSESRAKGGKKRIQPLLMVGQAPAKKAKPSVQGDLSSNKRKGDSADDAMKLAERAATETEVAIAIQKTQKQNSKQSAATAGDRGSNANRVSSTMVSHPTQVVVGMQGTNKLIPHSTERIHSVELSLLDDVDNSANGEKRQVVADCTNSIQVPTGSVGSALPCTIVSISRAGQTTWKDQLVGTSCSAIAASNKLLAVGTSDGAVQLYGTSPTLGWSSGVGFRSFPAFVVGHPVVALHFQTNPSTSHTEMLVVTADGTFGVYTVTPGLIKKFKGTIMPPMTHMLLSADMTVEMLLPKLSRIQITESGKLMLLLSLYADGRHGNESRTNHDNAPSVGAGGSLQGFVYSEESELWMRVADSRFVLSDFYSTLPRQSSAKRQPKGPLASLADAVRLGATTSTLRSSRRNARAISGSTAGTAYSQASERDRQDMVTRTHCEDRIACSLALESAPEFEYWFAMYVKTLAVSGDETLLRLVVDMLIGRNSSSDGREEQQATAATGSSNKHPQEVAWWLSEAPTIFSLDRVQLIKSVVISEMSKNRALQRITNEISTEIEALTPF